MRQSTRSRFSRFCICLLALITILCSLAVGCSQGTGPESVLSTSSDIGADGGELELIASDGTACRLTIPAGLLSATTEIKITAVSSSRGSSLGALSDDFLIEPEGLEFDTPVNVEITLAKPVSGDRVPAILHPAANGSGILLETQVEGQTLTASLTHFSYLGPVAPTAQELELYWDTAELEIEADGVSVERVHRLASAYLHAQAGGDAYASIDLSLWGQRLWAHTNDLIIMGSLRCSSGDYEEGGYILRAARGFAALCFFADLEVEAEQALQNCRELPEGYFPEIYWRVSDVVGIGEIFINDWAEARAQWSSSGHPGDTGWIGPLRERAADGTPWVQTGQNTLVLTFRFVIRHNPYRLQYPSGFFEVKVDGEMFFSKQLEAELYQSYEETKTLTIPGVSPPSSYS